MMIKVHVCLQVTDQHVETLFTCAYLPFMSNVHFIDKFPNANAQFVPFVASDHSPAVIAIPDILRAKPRPFKFANYLASHGDFLPIVKEVWSSFIPGYSMFSVVSKLKMLKKPLRKLRLANGNLSEKVRILKAELEKVQANMEKDFHNVDLRLEELFFLNAYNKAIRDEEEFLNQRSKVEWLSAGDSNTKFFHNAVKE